MYLFTKSEKACLLVQVYDRVIKLVLQIGMSTSIRLPIQITENKGILGLLAKK